MTGTPLQRYRATAERAANQVIASYSTSFGAATRLFGRRHRQHIRNIYALVRVADELVDGVAAGAGLALGEQEASLARFVAETHRAMDSGYSSDLVIHAFACTARECGITRELVDPFFASMRSDLAEERSLDRDEHDAYVYGSAEVVGLMCLRVFVKDRSYSPGETERLEAGARALGAAFQDINFLRDLAEDTGQLSRSYLGAAGRLDTAARDRWIGQIRAQLRTADEAVRLLPRDARIAVRSATALFAEVVDRIERTSVEELYQRRVSVPNPVKARLIGRVVASGWLVRA